MLTSTGAAATATVAGSPYAIRPSGAVGMGLSNYTITYHDGQLSVNPKGLDITANNRSKTYGEVVTFAGTEFTTVMGQLVNSDTVTSVTLTSAGAAATATTAGSPYAITPSAAMGTGLGNYAISYHNAPVGFTVNPKGLDITANDRSKTYGQVVSFAGTEFTVGPGQLVNGDTVTSVTLTSAGAAATANVVGSPYVITPSAAVGAGLGNYTISYHNAPMGLTVSKAALTIKADDKTIVLHAALPTFTVTPTGLVNGETLAVLGGSLTFTPTTTPANAGAYDIVPSGLTSNNYNISFQKGTLTVTYSIACTSFGDSTHTILQPINADGSSVNKAGSTVPAKFRVTDANCNSIGTLGVVTAFKLIGQSSDPSAVINEEGNVKAFFGDFLPFVSLTLIALDPCGGLVKKARQARDGGGQAVRTARHSADFDQAERSAADFGSWGVKEKSFPGEQTKSENEAVKTACNGNYRQKHQLIGQGHE